MTIGHEIISKLTNSKLIKTIVALLIIASTAYYIALRIFEQPNSWETIIKHHFDLYDCLTITSVGVLMLINWSLESTKWQMALRPICRISFSKSLQAIFASLSLAIITPNRIGEIGGRAMFVEPQFRLSAIAITTLSSFSQLTATIVWAGFSIPAIIEQFSDFLFLGIAISLFAIVGFIFLPKYLIKKGNRLILSKLKIVANSITEQPTTYFIKMLALSLSRYSVFIIQYLLMMKIFGIEIDIWHGILCVGAVYGLSTIIPTVALAELGMRTTAAVICFGIFSDNISGIVAASFSVWIINVAIPSMIGTGLWLLRIKK